MDFVDLDYYRQRLAAEEAATQRARHPAAAQSHQRMAQEYARLIVANDLDGPRTAK
jgi:hypothetical protein